MLAGLGYALVVAFTVLIMTKRMTPLTALIVTPILFGAVAVVLSGKGLVDLGPMMIEGVKTLAPTGVMLLFAILFFGLMTDTGLFDPAVAVLVRVVKGDPQKIILGTVVLGAVVSLDGDGSTTYIITCAALMPLYQRLGLNRLYLVCLLMLVSGVMNLSPWGGPTARAASALHLDVQDVFLPLIPGIALGLVALLGLAFLFGRAERKRLGVVEIPDAEEFAEVSVSQHPEARRPKLILVNAALVVGLLAGLILGVAPLPVMMMAAFAVGLVINYPHIETQKARIAAHAGPALAVASLIFAAGIFTGILQGTGMVEAMSRWVVAAVPAAWGPYMAPITAGLSLPFTFFLSNDAFYFGVLPILAEAGEKFGVDKLEIARASLMGQPFHLLSPLVPSTYLLVSLAGVDLADHQKFTAPFAAGVCLVMATAAVALGAFPFGA